jgi:hypothetical protein
MNGEWRITFGEKTPRLESGLRCWRAEQGPWLNMEAACRGSAVTVRIFWKRLDDDRYDVKKSLSLELQSAGGFHNYHADLGSSPEYRGLITGLAIEPLTRAKAGEQLAVKSIVLSPRQQ